MSRIAQNRRLDRVQHIVASGTGILDFAVEGESGYYTWDGQENADWKVDDVGYIENIEEDRFIIYPNKEFFICEIDSEREEGNDGPVRCWCE